MRPTGKICQSYSDVMIDNDDEDDYEGYFLRPANEYNIKEKIKLANQESFAIPTPPSPKFAIGERRVTFREQLVDYEPDEYSDVEEEDAPGETNSNAHDVEQKSPLDINDCTQSKNATGEMDEVDEEIIEELSINEPPEDDVESGIQTVTADDDGQEEEEHGDYDELEEEVTESSFDTEIHNPETASEDSSSPTKTHGSEEVSVSGQEEVNYSEESQNDDDNSEEREIMKERLMRESLMYDQERDDSENAVEEPDADRESPVQEHFRKRSMKCQRKCCRFKKTTDEKLPYYNGFHSEYGLSKEELDAKNKRLEAKKKRFYERHQRKVEEKQIKAQTNEEAFSAWLNKKLKNSINKYQNMYDYKEKKHKRRLSKDNSISMTA
ncbi:protein SDA1 homolog [Sabethes cyaneus]|uniref:protein SDA1 homolog n=1 Tax=Sabethes cyaneus TaxID=53552 RepID=UPI00237E1580|nr:protein SDA1 homolog [Sabethes cyaneus]